jgi:hypothetical protein
MVSTVVKMRDQTSSAIAHGTHGLLVPIEMRPDISAALPAYRAGEAILHVGQPEIVGPLIGIDGDAVAAAIVNPWMSQNVKASVPNG